MDRAAWERLRALSSAAATATHDLAAAVGALEPQSEPAPAPAPLPVEPTPTTPGAPLTIFDEHVGFGSPHLIDPVHLVVDSDADSGPGSLRAAIAGDAHKHITFAADMTIVAGSLLKPGSNTLIDGRGRNVAVKGTPGNGVFALERVSNVTLTDLAIGDAGNLALTSADDPHDGIIMSGADHIWLHHLDLSRCSDKAIGMNQGTTHVTVSWCHFHDQEQTFQSGNDFDGEAQGSLARLTAHHNYFDGTGYRHPVMSYGRAHVWNNFYRDFDLYGVRSQRIAKTHFEANVMMLVRNQRVTLIGGTGGADKDTRPGYLTAVGNVALPGSLTPKYQTAGHDFVPSDHYAYTADVAGQALADAIVAGAGPRRV